MDIVLIYRLIIHDHGTYIDYIQGYRNIVTYQLSIFPINGKSQTTDDSIYKKKIVSEINDIKKFTEMISLVNIKLIDQYQQKDPSLMTKYRWGNVLVQRQAKGQGCARKESSARMKTINQDARASKSVRAERRSRKR